MATLEELRKSIRERNGVSKQPAGRVIVLEPDSFLEEYEGRPAASVAVGLRTPNSDDYQTARAKETDDAAMKYVVSVGICDPNDCTLRHPAPVFEFADIAVEKALKPATVAYLFDQIELLHIETSPVIDLANDDELFVLGEILQLGDAMKEAESDPIRSARIRRLATVLIDALSGNE